MDGVIFLFSFFFFDEKGNARGISIVGSFELCRK